MEMVYLVAALANGVAAVPAWAAKLWWGKEHIAAKNETIKAKEAEIGLSPAPGFDVQRTHANENS